MGIKRGVSLYSYQQAEFLGRMTWKDELREVATNLGGANGIEIISETTIPQYPIPPEKFFFEWNNEMARWGLKAVTMDCYTDTAQFRDHLMTYEECAFRIKYDLQLAKKMGFENIRLVHDVPFEAIELALPLAEKLDVRITNEIHDPASIKPKLEGGMFGRWSRRAAEDVCFAQKHDTKHYGLQPDFSIFTARPSRLRFVSLLRSHGYTDEAANELFWATMQVREEQSPEASVEYFKQHGPVLSVDPMMAELMGPYDPYAMLLLPKPNANPEDLYDIAPYIFCCHGKFYDMTEIPGKPGQYQEYSMLYAEAIEVLKAIGYEGYIDSEFEGQRGEQARGDEHLVDEVVQVRRHHEMLKRLIGA